MATQAWEIGELHRNCGHVDSRQVIDEGNSTLDRHRSFSGCLRGYV
jgi:hypothetical protein